jgi:predicted metal-dependent phosphoesterase TrpH
MSDENDPYYTDAEERRQAINAILECTKYWPCTREHRVFKGLLAEITRLRAELAERGAELAFERAEIAALKDRIATALLDKAAVERGVMRLRADLAQRTAERDAARRDLCGLSGGFDVEQSRRVAKVRGWDCFDAPNTTDGRVQNGGA